MRQQIDIDEEELLPDEFYAKYKQWPTPRKFRKNYDPWKLVNIPPRTNQEKAEDDGWANLDFFLSAPPKYDKFGNINKNYWLAAAESWKILAKQKEEEIKKKNQLTRVDYSVLADGSTWKLVFIDGVLMERIQGTGTGKDFQSFEATFYQFGGGGRVPKILVTQGLNEVICVYASYCNFYQKLITETQFYNLFRAALNASPNYMRKSKDAKADQLREMKGKGGYSGAVLTLIFNHKHTPYARVGLGDECAKIKNGFVSAKVSYGEGYATLEFFHMFAIRNGYLLDSLQWVGPDNEIKRGLDPYKWNGIIQGYNNFIISSAIDMDKKTKVEKRTIIELD